MNTDIRLSLSFKNHRKKRKLQARLGSDGVLSLIYLWIATAENKPDGVLGGYTIEDIELEADWFGESGLFVKTLMECGLLDYDESEKVYSLHNWSTRQEWVSKSTERSDKARFSRIARTHPELYAELKEGGVNAISKEQYAKLTNTIRTVNEPLKKMEQPANESLAKIEQTVNDSLTVINETLQKPNESLATVNETLTPAPAPSPTHNVVSSDFELFWDMYAKKVGKEKCEKAWSRISQKQKSLIFQRLPDYIEATQDKQYRKNPLTWLNGKHWNDELEKTKPVTEQNECDLPVLG